MEPVGVAGNPGATTVLPSAVAGTAAAPVTGIASSAPPSAARVLFARGQEIVRTALSNQRPWAEMVDRSAFAKPESLNEATGRIRKNLSYFRINYGILMFAVMALSLVVNPSSIFVLALVLAGWTYLYVVRKEALIVFGRTFTEREVLLSMTGISIVVIIFSGVASLLLTAGVVGCALIAAHGAFKVPDDLFLDDQEASGGFLSFLGPATVSAVPVAVSRV
ncbi:unnamed protein product [Sphagnum balticum]